MLNLNKYGEWVCVCVYICSSKIVLYIRGSRRLVRWCFGSKCILRFVLIIIMYKKDTQQPACNSGTVFSSNCLEMRENWKEIEYFLYIIGFPRQYMQMEDNTRYGNERTLEKIYSTINGAMSWENNLPSYRVWPNNKINYLMVLFRNHTHTKLVCHSFE